MKFSDIILTFFINVVLQKNPNREAITYRSYMEEALGKFHSVNYQHFVYFMKVRIFIESMCPEKAKLGLSRNTSSVFLRKLKYKSPVKTSLQKLVRGFLIQ